MPLDGQLQHTVHIPGRIFSVAPFAVREVPRLFARNERLACHFDGPHGPFVMVMVGAMLVSGVETVWSGEEIPPYARQVTQQKLCESVALHWLVAQKWPASTWAPPLSCCCPRADALDGALSAEQAVRLGMRLGQLPESA